MGNAATITKKVGRTMNVFTVAHSGMPGWEREFLGNKERKAAEKYAEWLNKLAALAKAAKDED